MDTAWSLYLDRKISASEALNAQVSTRPVCPRCRELVHLVRRISATHFSHWPKRADSPDCALRAASGPTTTTTTTSSGPPREEWLRESQTFRRALLDTHRLAEPELPDVATAALLSKVADMLQRTWRVPPQTLDAGAREHRNIFPLASEAIVREALRAPNLEHPELNSEAHLHAVLRLWRHLHQPQVESDLIFLLQLALVRANIGAEEITQANTDALEYVMVLDRLFDVALWLLARVPWMKLWGIAEIDSPPPAVVPGSLAPASRARVRIEQCDDCGFEVENAWRCPRCRVPLCEEHAKQHKDWTCPDCGQRPCETRSMGPFAQCWVCNEWICSECRNQCSCCTEDICEDCYHESWSCEGCGDEFCENAPEEEQKTECSSCDNPYCERCARDLASCPDCKSQICDQCSEECDECSVVFCGQCLGEHVNVHDAEA